MTGSTSHDQPEEVLMLQTRHSMTLALTVLLLGATANAQGCTLPDIYEPNDTCATATQLGTGVFFTTSQISTPRDHYRFVVPAGQTLDCAVNSDDAGGALDHQLTLLAADCSTVLETATGSFAHAELDWLNATGAAADVILQVKAWTTHDASCANTVLSISLTPNPVGTPLCFGDGSTMSGGLAVDCPCGNAASAGEGCRNSHGYGAILSAFGTPSVANDDLTLSVSQARMNQPCMLLQGATRIAVPFKDGILCTGNPTQRMEVIFLDSSGAAASVESVVTNGNVSPGQTRYYQAWYRDPFDIAPCDGRSNLSQALEVVWN
jgi:hypothetical protein